MFKTLLYNLATDKYRGFFPGALKFPLFLLSLVYALSVRMLFFCSRIKPCRLGCKVISVGNITLGGTGKTVLVEYIARYLRKQGHKVAILSRGYKRPQAASRKPQATYENMGDEPYMLQMKLKDIPVIVDPDRVRSARLAIKQYGVDTVILDDGFQQWRIKKDLSIVTVHVGQGFGNGRLIPRGILRQPLSTLKSADLFVMTNMVNCDSIRKTREILVKINPQGEIFESAYHPIGFYNITQPQDLFSPEILKGKSVALVCGIANPDSFKSSITKIGISAGLSIIFPDHYRYSNKDWSRIREEAASRKIKTVVTTEKDASRLLSLNHKSWGLDIFVLRIELKIQNDEQKFFHRLLGIYSL